MKKIISSLICLVLICTALASLGACTVPVSAADPNAAKYTEALELLANGDYEGAKAAFETLGDYKDSEKHLERFHYLPVEFVFDYYGVEGSRKVIFNENGIPVREFGFEDDASVSVEFFYDESNAIVKIVENYEDGTYVSEFGYDENGRCNKLISSYPDGYSSTYTYVYDASGAHVTSEYTNTDGESRTYNFTYNEQGNLIREECIENGETTVMEMEYTYDEQGRITERVTNYSDGAPMTLVVTYDDQNHTSKQTYTTEYGVYVFECFYNENGEIVKEIYTNPDGEVNFMEIEYVLLYVTDNFSDLTEDILNDHWTNMI